MKDLSLEFGLLIAYAIPGAFGLLGIAAYISDLNFILVQEKESIRLPFALLISGLSITLGMFISVLRALTIDATFQIDFPFFRNIGRHWRRVNRVDVDYSVVNNNELLSALQDARLNEKRPYQFYGNMLISIILFELPRFTSNATSIFEKTLVMLVIIAFYFASRKSHYRYALAIQALNRKTK
jgi:hypothetical protein